MMSKQDLILLDSVTKSLESIMETVETAKVMGVYDMSLAESARHLIRTWLDMTQSD